MKFSAILKTKSNKSLTADVYEKVLENNVKAVYINGRSQEALDSEHGADILLTLPDVEGMVALNRYTEFWCEPVFTGDFSEIPEETQLLIAKHSDGTFTLLLPVVSEKYRCVLYGDEKGIHARLCTHCDGICECQCLALTCLRSTDLAKASDACFISALKEMNKDILPRNKRAYPEIFEYLGWCSWDALEIRVSEEGLLEKCREFKEKNIPVRWGILDDMWATVPKFNTEKYSDRNEMFDLMHSSPLADFEAEPRRFPHGLGHAIAEMKKYLTWVGVWHPTTGYWYGIDPESELFKRFEKHLMCALGGRYIVKPTYEDYTVFLNAFHSFIKESGADFLKIDYQSIVRRFYKQCGTVGEISAEFHRAIEDSVKKYFDLRLINCMGCAGENIWNRPESPVSRCSGDFQPEDKEWFTHHVLQCAYTCLLQEPVIYSDWDMWWSGDAQGIKNSVIRAVSGGPIYVSDKIGESVREVIMPLVLRNGRILRCDRPAAPTIDCFCEDPRVSGKIFKIQNLASGSGVIAAFNLDPGEKETHGTLSPGDVPDLEGEKFAVYEHITKETFTLEKGEKIPLTLKNRDDFRLYTLTPVKNEFAVIGLCDKFISPLTVRKVDGTSYELYEEGECLIYRDGKFLRE